MHARLQFVAAVMLLSSCLRGGFSPSDSGASDAAPPDADAASADMGDADTAMDLVSDATGDGTMTDALPPVDGLGDALADAPGQACADILKLYPNGQMAACATAPMNQCDALQACGLGWHLCSATEYVLNGGSGIDPGVAADEAWTASCIASGGAKIQPTQDTICGSCVDTTPFFISEFQCAVSSPMFQGYEDQEIGLRSAQLPIKVNGPGETCAYWKPAGTSVLLSRVICCQD